MGRVLSSYVLTSDEHNYFLFWAIIAKEIHISFKFLTRFEVIVCFFCLIITLNDYKYNGIKIALLFDELNKSTKGGMNLKYYREKMNVWMMDESKKELE